MILEARLATLGLQPIYGTYRPLSSDEIATLEALMGGALPDDYKAFVSKFGCSYFGESAIVVRPATLPPREVTSTGLLGFGAFFGGGQKEYALLVDYELDRGRMPETVFPFACDHTGSQFCLGVIGNDQGRVYYWWFAHEQAPEDYIAQGLPVPDDLWYCNMTLVADSFTDFVNRLEKREDS